ncbi:MAG: DUF2795 domain-containing protein [Mycobacteriales bacterium]
MTDDEEGTTVERGSDKHGPRRDDELASETEGMTRSAHGTHAEEWAEPEPSGEDQPVSSLDPTGPDVGGTPPGMSGEDVEGRSELGAALRRGAYPTDRDGLIVEAARANAPDTVIDELRRLPDDRRSYQNVEEVWEALGHPGEAHRT